MQPDRILPDQLARMLNIGGADLLEIAVACASMPITRPAASILSSAK